MPMEVGNCRLIMEKVGNDVPLFNVTPAECQFLHIIHNSRNGGKTFGEKMDNIEVIGTAMVDTGQREKVITKEAIPTQTIRGKVIKDAIPEQLIKGKPPVGKVGDPNYQAAIPDTRIPAQPEQKEPDVVVPEQPEQSYMKPILRVRTSAEEYRRLASKYNGAKDKTNTPIIRQVFPDKNKLPERFSELVWPDITADASEIATAPLNYATGALATTQLPS